MLKHTYAQVNIVPVIVSQYNATFVYQERPVPQENESQCVTRSRYKTQIDRSILRIRYNERQA